MKTQQIPYPFAQVPPAIPPRKLHSAMGRQFPVSPEAIVQPPGPHFTTVTNGRTMYEAKKNLILICLMLD